MEVSEYLTSTQEQRAERKAKYLERKALLESGQDADRMRAQDRALKALFLLQEHINGNRTLNDIERVTLSGIVAERSLDSFFFFAKHVLGMDLLTEQTHKRWADDLQKAIKRRKKRLMRMKPRGTYKCLAKGTKLLGVGINEEYKLTPALLYNQGDFFEEGIKVTMSSGKSFVCTKDHPFKTIEGWGPAKVGLRVASVRELPNPYIPINEAQEYMMGLLVGDGTLTKSTPKLSCAETNILDIVKNYGFILNKTQTKGYDYRVLNFVDKVRACGLEGTNSWSKFIPKEYEGSANFLRGLFDADASVSKKDARIVFVTVSEKLADDVLRNLLYFGIVARKRFYKYPKSEKSPAVECFHISIYNGFIDKYHQYIGFNSTIKKERLEHWIKERGSKNLNHNVDTIPKEWKKFLQPNEKKRIRYELGLRIDSNYANSREKVLECGKFLNNEKVINIATADIFWDKIIRIENLGPVEFSAIGSSSGNYLTEDGMIHHNTSVYGIAFILWLWGCVSPQIRIFYTSANSLLLQEVADKLNQYIGTAKSETLFSLIFGITKDSVAKNTSDVFNITGRSGKGFSLVFRTSGGSSVGIHPNICIVDDPCFVGETPVLTSRGYVHIKDIRVGDLVMTRSGYKEVLRSWKTRENADVMDYRINGRILSCTPKHKIITEQGKKEISQLKDETIIKFEGDIWKSEKLERPKLLSIWGLNIGDILIPKIYRIVNISWQVAMLIAKLLFYTVRFGFSTMALFLKDFMFTTRMIISTKTNFLTSNLSVEGNIIQNIQRGDCQIPGKEKLITNTLQKSELQLMNGIVQRRVGKRLEKFTTLYQILKKRVNVVARSFLQKISQKQGKSIVQKNVGLRGINRRKADVYNLTVKDVHEFIANGVLVSNCDQNDRDSETTRQGKIRWFDGLTPLLVPFFDPKTGIELETILYIGTPWHMRDLTWHIQEMNKKLPEDSSWDIESESVFDENRQARYPEFFPMSKIMEIKASISDVFFSCQYECSPLPEGMQIFDLKKLFFVREDQLALEIGEWLCVFDPAQGKGHNDYAAVWWLHYQNEKITVYSAIDEKIELNLIVHQIAHRNRELGCRHMIFENNGMGLIEDSLKAAHSRLNWHITIDSIHHSSNKEERIISMQPVLYSGKVQFMADYEQRYPEAMSQLVFYGAYGHDDFPDCLQMGIEYFMQPRFKFQRYEGCL